MTPFTNRTVARSPALGLAAISLGFLMITLDATIVNVALGPIGASLGGSVSTAQWIVNGYTLAFAVLLLSAGALADRIGLRGEAGIGKSALLAGPRARDYYRRPHHLARVASTWPRGAAGRPPTHRKPVRWETRGAGH
jgi:hypothetical protein